LKEELQFNRMKLKHKQSQAPIGVSDWPNVV
jgi:hypothetical protein